ncbi:uncharacterized protein LOC112575159 [Pomacea canaliculata]|uniref:uncharacterized protein LOC112575159 n=1 Tax=Pomacea canaliculata TaxID=400727 RepID=UPI000D739C33|nr:uncharacterized protein LOC112575159 [Pomacea canaliculata]XP_025112579.1 uncharacterized protein LOC112575159 [Pomacea canaliculata]
MDSFALKFFLFLCCLCFLRASTKEMGRCDAPPVDYLQDAVLTCNFPEDLSVSKKGFSVYHYFNPENPDAVLDCWWLGDGLECHIKSGFEYDKIVSRTLNITIRHVTSARTGTYGCQVDGYGTSDLGQCQLNLTLGENNTCNVSNVPNDSQITLTCFFNENVQTTQNNFSVFRHNGQEKLEILHCWWVEGKPKCQVDGDYLYDYKVSTYLIIKSQKITKVKKLTYSCRHAGSTLQQQAKCSLEISKEVSEKDISTHLAIGLPLALTVVIAAIIVIVILLRRNNCIIGQRKTRTSVDDEHHPMIKKESNEELTTRTFQEYLVKNIEEMYPDTLDSFYFVPPVYFNKLRYETQTIAGQVVYVPQPPDLSDVRHDRTMQHVLHCLRHMAEHYKEDMFVLSQFKYEDYLNKPGNNFANHGLPVPARFEGKTNVDCFDILIIHRRFGVLIGIVKSPSDRDDGSEDYERKIHNMLVSEVCEAVTQVKYAKSMMEHLMSDQKHKPAVQMGLMFPNVTLSSLQRVLGNHSKVTQSLRECVNVKPTDDPTQLCLCANHLSNPCAPWDIDTSVMSHLRKWWDRLMNQSDADPKMTDEMYLNMIARFCGPATQSTTQLMDETVLQPKTLADAVTLTGDLYERLTLYPNMIEMLSEEKLFLVGPPNTGKTRMLTLAGKQWVESGHHLYILVSIFTRRDFMSSFSKTSNHTPATKDTDETSRPLVTCVRCHFNIKKEMKEILDMLTTQDKKNIPLCVIASEVDFGGKIHYVDKVVEKGQKENKRETDQQTKRKSWKIRKYFKTFVESLSRQNPNLVLWATSSTSQDVPEGWKVQTFTRALTCPPAVVREASRAGADYFIPEAEIKPRDCLTPTDGPQVKYIYHKMDSTGYHDCSLCGRKVADFLNKHLVTKSNKTAFPDDITEATTSTLTRVQHESRTLKASSILQDKDILVIFENDKNEYSFLRELTKVGFQVQPLEVVNDKEVVREEDCVCSMHVDRCRKFRQRRKIVVYVEGRSPPEDVSNKWRGITSCMAQLIVVRWTTT